MPEHYTRNTESVRLWCPKCSRYTTHPVSDGKAGRCAEHQPQHLTEKQNKAAQRAADEYANPRLFP